MLLYNDLIYPRIDPRVYKEALSLIKHDIDVTVVCWAADFSREGESFENLKKNEIFEDIKIKRIFQKISSYRKTIFVRALQQFCAMIKLAREAILEKPDVVHSHDLNTLLSGIIVKKKLNIPLIYDSHEDWPGFFEDKNGITAGRICKIYEKILLSQADVVITVSKEIGKKFEDYGHETYIIYNSRKLEEVENVESETIRNHLNISVDDFVVGYIGTVDSKRGLDKLIESFEHVKEKNIKLLFVGGEQEELKNLRNKVKDEYSNRVTFTGQIPYHKVLDYFSILNIGCILFQPLPGYFLAAPNKLFEYMSMGIPLLVSDFPEMRRIIIDSNCGVCVDPTNPKKIADTIIWFYEHPDECKKMGKNGQRAIKNKYSWNKMEEMLVNIYKNITLQKLSK